MHSAWHPQLGCTIILSLLGIAGCQQSGVSEQAQAMALLTPPARWTRFVEHTDTRDGRLHCFITLTRPQTDGLVGSQEMWLLEWTSDGAKGLTLCRSMPVDRTGAAGKLTYHLLDAGRVAIYNHEAKSLSVVCLKPDGATTAQGPAIEVDSFPCGNHYNARADGRKVAADLRRGPIFSRNGAFMLCAGSNGGVYDTRTMKKVRDLPTSEPWRDMIAPQACEMDYPVSRLMLSDDGAKVVRLPYIWRWDEGGVADEYTVALVYDFGTGKVKETTLRVGDKARVHEAVLIDGKVWFALTVTWAQKPRTLVVTDLERTTTFSIPCPEGIEDPIVWDINGKRLLRIMPQGDCVELINYKTGTVEKATLSHMK